MGLFWVPIVCISIPSWIYLKFHLILIMHLLEFPLCIFNSHYWYIWIPIAYIHSHVGYIRIPIVCITFPSLILFEFALFTFIPLLGIFDFPSCILNSHCWNYLNSYCIYSFPCSVYSISHGGYLIPIVGLFEFPLHIPCWVCSNSHYVNSHYR